MNHIDQRFRAEAIARSRSAAADAEKRAADSAKLDRIRQQVRAEYSSATKTILIDGPIGAEEGELSAKWLKSQLPSDGSPITVRIHSEGGALFEAFGMFDAIANYPGKKTAIVESMAFSAASLLLAAFDHVEITPNGYVMLHSPSMGTADELDESQQRLLAQLRERMIGIYADATGKPRSFIAKELEREVFYDAEASIDLGLVNSIAKRSSAVVAKLPARVLARVTAAKQSATSQWRSAVDALASSMPRAKAITSVDKSHPGLRQKMIAEANQR